MRNANASHDTRGADRAWADTDFNCVCACFGQGQSSGAGGDIAANHLHLREILFNPTYAVDHAFGVTVSGVDHHHINASRHEGRDAIRSVFTRADRCAYTQTTLIVLAGQWVSLGFFDVVNGHHAFEGKFVVNDQNTLDAVFVQQLAGFFFVRAFLDRHQTLFRRHDVTNGGFKAVFKAHVAGRHDADQVAILQHRNTGDIVLASQFEQFTYGGIGLDGDGFFNHTSLETLDLAHFVSLLLDGHVLVDDTDTAFLSHGDCQTGFSYGVHCSGNQRNIQFNATGQTSL